MQSLTHTYKRYRTLQTHRISALPVVILMPHSACNCRCVMCDIWKDNKNLKQLTELNASQNLGMNILTAKDHAEAFLMVETGRATAFVMDDILLASLAASSKAPNDYMISTEALSVEPYGLIERKGDPAFKKVVDTAIINLMKSGEINKIYAKWFTSPIPPKGINLNVPMSPQLAAVIAKPTPLRSC